MACSFVLEHRSEIVRRTLTRMRGAYPSREGGAIAWPLDDLLDRMSGVHRRGPAEAWPTLPTDELIELVGVICDVVIELVAERHWQTDSLIHEIRNALSTAILASRMIREGRAPVHGHTCEILARSHHRMQALVSFALGEIRLLAPARPRQEPLDLAGLLEEIAEAAFPDREVHVRVDAPRSVRLQADEQLLTSAVENLVQNAVKFTRPGEDVTIRSWETDHSVIIEVEDRCGGLPPGSVDDLFRPYVQMGSDRTGVGLGLAIAQRAVEAHGGRISARDLPGLGCVFTIELPALGAGGERSLVPG